MAILSIILAAAAGFGWGAVWYMTNADRWMAAVGKTKEEIEASTDKAPYAIGIAASLLTAIMLRHILASAGVSGAFAGLVAGLGTGLCLAAPWIVLNYAFAGRPRSLWWIDALHVVGAQGLIGLVLGFFL